MYMLICIWQEKDLENNWRRIFPALYPWKSSSSLSGIPEIITMTEHWGNRQLRIWLGISWSGLFWWEKNKKKIEKIVRPTRQYGIELPTGHFLLTEFFRVAISSRLVLSKSANWWNAFHSFFRVSISASGIPLKMVRLLPAAPWYPCPLPADIQEI